MSGAQFKVFFLRGGITYGFYQRTAVAARRF